MIGRLPLAAASAAAGGVAALLAFGPVIAEIAAVDAGREARASSLEAGLDRLWTSIHPSEREQLCHRQHRFDSEVAASIATMELGGDQDYWVMAIARHCAGQ